jgi:hypothetical protein
MRRDDVEGMKPIRPAPNAARFDMITEAARYLGGAQLCRHPNTTTQNICGVMFRERLGAIGGRHVEAIGGWFKAPGHLFPALLFCRLLLILSDKVCAKIRAVSGLQWQISSSRTRIVRLWL